MDRILRRYARRGGETLRGALGAGNDVAAAAGGAHLDADEMNAYSEGALPEAARSRYFAHLADCDTCRKLVTELTLAASASNEGKSRVASLEAAAPPKSWRDWLAAIFSPPVLRYGVPALALFAVIVVVVVAMRSQRKELSVAQNTQETKYYGPTSAANSNSAETTASTASAENHPGGNAALPAPSENQTQPGAMATPPPAKPTTLADAPVVSQETVVNKPEPAQTEDNRVIARKSGEANERAQEETAAAAPPPAPKSPVLSAPAAEPENSDRRDEQKKSKAAGKDDDALPVNGRAAAGAATANKREADAERNVLGSTSATTRAPQSQTRRRPSAASKSGPADAAADKEGSAATRNVGGRQFQRQGGAWVDTSYNSSRSTTNVRRGSEQYRALIADEPGLRSIAEQLGGEVIVVWKSRAYRFY
jgi:hypothetical protein